MTTLYIWGDITCVDFMTRMSYLIDYSSSRDLLVGKEDDNIISIKLIKI